MTIDARRMTYSVEEAAAILGVSKSKIYDSVRNGELRGVQVGRRVVVPCDALETLMAPSIGGESRESSEGAPSRDGGTELNAVSLSGRIARQPALRVSRTGIAVCTLRLAVSRRRRDGGPRSPLHVDVVAFGAVAEAAGGHRDGDQVTILGRLGERVWTSADGLRHTGLEIVADTIGPALRPKPGTR
jgi:single-strand DNA-binding protein